MNEKAQNGSNSSNHSIFRKMFFYKQVSEFHCPSKILCQTSERQNHWSLLKVDLDGISVDEFHQPAGKHHLYFSQPADHSSQHQPATAAAQGGCSLFSV
jgi:hypothetical protein